MKEGRKKESKGRKEGRNERGKMVKKQGEKKI